MKKLISIALAVLMIAACFAGCQNSAKDSQSDASAASGKTKKWVVATDTVFKPFEYTDKENNFVGIDVDILAAVAKDQNFEYELKSLGWDSAIAACKSNQADAMIAGASITEKRQNEGWIFSDGYYTATQCMTVKSDSTITKTVAVKTGTMGAAYAESLKDKYGFTLTYLEDSPTMYQTVVGGQAAACFEDTPIMITSIKDNGYALKVVEGTENEGSDYGVAIFDSSKQEFLDMFNAGLKNIKASGEYDKIIDKYLG